MPPISTIGAEKEELSKSQLMIELDGISNCKDEAVDDRMSSNNLLFHPSAESESNMTYLMNNGIERKLKRADVAQTMITETHSMSSMDCNRLSRAD